MNRNEKLFVGISAAVVLTMLVMVGGGYGWFWYRMHNIQTYNRNFERTYRESLLAQDLEIVSEERFVKYSSKWLFGENVKTKPVWEDVYGAYYFHRFTVHDRLIDYDYAVSVSHVPRGKLEPEDDAITYYRERAEIYAQNFALMREIIEEHGGAAEQISVFDPNQMEDYLLLVYLPDAASMIETQDDLYDRVYGGYAWEHLDETRNINISIPRFVFCADEATYRLMCSNLDLARNYVRGKNYECCNSKQSTNKISLRALCTLMLGDSSHLYTVTEVPDVNTLRSPATKNYLMGINVTDWIALYELEIGVSYYLTVFE